MWYRVTYSHTEWREEKYTELIFSYEDKLTDTLASKLDISAPNLVIHEIEKYSIKEGTA